MRFEELFDNRIVFADKLKICMREAGYTKVSFAKKADISCPTLDCILNGELDNKNIFDKHIQKIFGVLEEDVNMNYFRMFWIFVRFTTRW